MDYKNIPFLTYSPFPLSNPRHSFVLQKKDLLTLDESFFFITLVLPIPFFIPAFHIQLRSSSYIYIPQTSYDYLFFLALSAFEEGLV